MSKYMIFFSTDQIDAGMVTAAPVYVTDILGGTMELIEANTVITHEVITKLYRNRVKRVLIFTDELHAEQPQKIENSPEVSPMLDESLRDEAITGIRNLFTAVDSGSDTSGNMTTAYQVVKELDDVVDDLLKTISSEAGGLVHISGLKSYDEYTYHHSLSVCVLAIAIAQEMGFNRWELKRLSRCAIMHDIGKVKVPFELITKPDKLTTQEFSIVKQHPEKGVEYLKRENIGNEELWMGVLHHHEKYDGSGYPSGIKGNDIPLYSRIVAVADVYDAITSYRSYRKPIVPPIVALEMIMSDAGRAFDYDVVSAFVKKLELYPINTIIELSDGRKGIVVDNRNSVRPILKMLDSNTLLDLADMNNLHRSIIEAGMLMK